MALEYDAEGRLTASVQNGLRIEAAYDAAGQPVRLYVWTPDGRLLWHYEGPAAAARRYHHHDTAGSTLALTDDGGAVTDRYAYDPFGRLLAHAGESAQPFAFLGEWGVERDPAVPGLYRIRVRWYDAATARFLSPDPLWPQPANPALNNPYAYALGNPIALQDVNGLYPNMVMVVDGQIMDIDTYFADSDYGRLFRRPPPRTLTKLERQEEWRRERNQFKIDSDRAFVRVHLALKREREAWARRVDAHRKKVEALPYARSYNQHKKQYGDNPFGFRRTVLNICTAGHFSEIGIVAMRTELDDYYADRDWDAASAELQSAQAMAEYFLVPYGPEQDDRREAVEQMWDTERRVHRIMDQLSLEGRAGTYTLGIHEDTGAVTVRREP